MDVVVYQKSYDMDVLRSVTPTCRHVTVTECLSTPAALSRQKSPNRNSPLVSIKRALILVRMNHKWFLMKEEPWPDGSIKGWKRHGPGFDTWEIAVEMSRRSGGTIVVTNDLRLYLEAELRNTWNA